MDSEPQLLTFYEDDIDSITYELLSPPKKMKLEELDEINCKDENSNSGYLLSPPKKMKLEELDEINCKDENSNSGYFSTESFAMIKDELNLSDQEFNFESIDEYLTSSPVIKDVVIISDDESVKDYPSIDVKNEEGMHKKIEHEEPEKNSRMDSTWECKEMEDDGDVVLVENSDSDVGNLSPKTFRIDVKNEEGMHKRNEHEEPEKSSRMDSTWECKEMEDDGDVVWVENSDSDVGNSSPKTFRIDVKNEEGMHKKNEHDEPEKSSRIDSTWECKEMEDDGDVVWVDNSDSDLGNPSLKTLCMGVKNNEGMHKNIEHEEPEKSTKMDSTWECKEMEDDGDIVWVENSDSGVGNSSPRTFCPKAKKKWIGWSHKNGLKLLNYFKCTYCSSVFSSWQNFDAHIRMNKNTLLVCSYCSFYARRTCGIYSHLRYIHNLSSFTITVDYSHQSLTQRELSNRFYRKFSDGSNGPAINYEGLMRSSDINERLNFLDCDKQENKNNDLGRYSRFFESVLYLGNEENSDNNEFRCCFCLCIVPNLVSLKMHMYRDHLTPESFDCKNCHFSRFFPSAFISVVKSHHSCKESECEPFLNEVMKPRTGRPINNNLQIENVWANTEINSSKNTSNILKQKKLKCGLCEFSPRSTKSIISHMLAKHTLLKLFECSRCDHTMYYPLIVFDKVESLHECRNLKSKDLTIYQNNKSILIEKNLKSSTSSTYSINGGMKRPMKSSHLEGFDGKNKGPEKNEGNKSIESGEYTKSDITWKNEEMEDVCDILWDRNSDSGMYGTSSKTISASVTEEFTKLKTCDVPKESLHPFIYFPDEFLCPDEKILSSWDDSAFDFSEDELKDPEKDPLAIEESGTEDKDVELSNSFNGLNHTKTEEDVEATDTSSETDEYIVQRNSVIKEVSFPSSVNNQEKAIHFEEVSCNTVSSKPICFERDRSAIEKDLPSDKIMYKDQITDIAEQLQWRKKRVFDFSFDDLGTTSKGLKLITEFHECQSCEMTFYNRMEFNKHVINHRENENPTIDKSKCHRDSKNQSIRCERCDFTTSSMASMRWHKVKHHPSGIRYFSCCPFCSYIVSSNRKMSEHIHLDHSCGSITKCLFCEHCYTQILCTHNHRASHDLTDNQPYICELCKHNSFSKEKFLMHVYNSHRDCEV